MLIGRILCRAEGPIHEVWGCELFGREEEESIQYKFVASIRRWFFLSYRRTKEKKKAGSLEWKHPTHILLSNRERD